MTQWRQEQTLHSSGQSAEGNCASMYSVHDRVTVDNMSEFEHTSSRASCTFSMQDSRVKRGNATGHKTQQARLPADSGLYSSTFPSLVNCILTIPERRSDRHGSFTSTEWSRQSLLSVFHPRASLGFEEFCANPPTCRQSVHIFPIVCCFCFYSCFAHCCHDPFIVRSASNLSTIPWFHSVCASVSMFAITDNCLFLFLFLSLGRCLNTTKASVQTSKHLHLHRSKPPRVHTKSAHVPSLHIC